MFPAPEQPTAKLTNWLGSLSDEELLDRWVFCREELTEVGKSGTAHEMEKRGLTASHQELHRKAWEGRLWRDSKGLTRVCNRCNRMATSRKWSIRKIFRLIPLIPIRIACCPDHGS